jgi:hypothetical protein
MTVICNAAMKMSPPTRSQATRSPKKSPVSSPTPSPMKTCVATDMPRRAPGLVLLMCWPMAVGGALLAKRQRYASRRALGKARSPCGQRLPRARTVSAAMAQVIERQC